jgi:hypothetical protein
MKSKHTLKLMKWLSDCTNTIDLPRDFTPEEAKGIIGIAESEYLGIDVTEKIYDFKQNWFKDCDIKSKMVEKIILERKSRLRPQDRLLLSEQEVIELVEKAEYELDLNSKKKPN